MAFVIVHKPTGRRLKRESSLWWTMHYLAKKDGYHRTLENVTVAPNRVGRLYGTRKPADEIVAQLGPEWEVQNG